MKCHRVAQSQTYVNIIYQFLEILFYISYIYIYLLVDSSRFIGIMSLLAARTRIFRYETKSYRFDDKL